MNQILLGRNGLFGWRHHLQLGSTVLLLAISALLLAACGGPTAPDGGPPGGGPPDAEGKPLAVEVVPDLDRSVTKTIPLEGGVLEATGVDGTTYTLAFNANSLLAETTVTMTPLQAVDGAPVTNASAFYGVHLEPDGARFFAPATLTIEPAGGQANVEAVTFAYQGDGEQFHAYPLSTDPNALRLSIAHFSGYVVYVGTALEVTAQPDEYMPSDWESQLEHEAHELFKAERDAQLRGEDGDPAFDDKLSALIQQRYDQFIAPLLPVVASDCSAAKQHASKLIAWARMSQLVGSGNEYSSEIAAIWDAIISGMKVCWEEVVEPCLDTTDAAELQEALLISRQLILLGEVAEEYDPFDLAHRCIGEWTGTITYTEVGSETTYPDDPRAVAGSTTLSHDLTQTTEISGVVSYGRDPEKATYNLAASWTTEAQVTLDYHQRLEEWDDCVGSAPDILRWVFVDSKNYDLTGNNAGEIGLLLRMYHDGTYEISVVRQDVLVSGTVSTYHYQIDNCYPDSEEEENKTEPLETNVSSVGNEVTGSVSADKPNSISGTLTFDSVGYRGIPITVTITWDLTYHPEE